VYVARVWGQPPDEGVVDLPLAREGGSPPRNRIDPGGLPAVTRYRVLSRDDRSALVEQRPETGRSHQLRVHLTAIGHPILGDRFYAPEDVVAAAPRLLLHAAELAIDHPYSGKRLVLRAPLPF
jgi:tRNA pseudouridine32 synthase/23S rRNA pseudouridine746 synthase